MFAKNRFDEIFFPKYFEDFINATLRIETEGPEAAIEARDILISLYESAEYGQNALLAEAYAILYEECSRRNVPLPIYIPRNIVRQIPCLLLSMEETLENFDLVKDALLFPDIVPRDPGQLDMYMLLLEYCEKEGYGDFIRMMGSAVNQLRDMIAEEEYSFNQISLLISAFNDAMNSSLPRNNIRKIMYGHFSKSDIARVLSILYVFTNVDF